MSGFFYENQTDRAWDGQDWDGGPMPGSPYNCWRNVARSTITNSRIANCRMRTAADHVEGMKIDLATGCRVYRTLFEGSDVMHLFVSYPFWGSSLGGVTHGAYCDDLLFEECGFGDLASTFGQAKYFHVQMGGTSSANYPRRIVFKNCFALDPIAFIGGNTSGVTVTNLMRVAPGGSVRQAMDSFAGTVTPPPPPVSTVEARLLRLEDDVAALKGSSAALRSNADILARQVIEMAAALSAAREPLSPTTLAAIEAQIKLFERSSPNIAKALRMLVGQDKTIAARVPLP